MSLDVYLTVPPCPHCNTPTRTVYSANCTHNLTTMADAAGLYQALWRPEELGIRKAAELIDVLDKGLSELRADPAKFKQFNPSNGWGDYEGLLEVVAGYLAACRQHPDAEVEVSR